MLCALCLRPGGTARRTDGAACVLLHPACLLHRTGLRYWTGLTRWRLVDDGHDRSLDRVERSQAIARDPAVLSSDGRAGRRGRWDMKRA